MSSTLMWESVVKVQRFELPDTAKYVLRARYGDGAMVTGIKLDCGQIEYLAGLRDAGIKGIQEIIDAIRQFDEIRIFEE